MIEYYFPWLTELSFFQRKPATLSEAYVLDQAASPQANKTSVVHRLQSHASTLTTIDMAAECMDHLVAGNDTISTSLCYLMHELSLPRCQDIQQRLHREIAQHLDSKVQELSYLDAVVKEGLRLYPAVPMTLPRIVPDQGRAISGYHLPARTIVGCQAYSVHLLNPAVFPAPEMFVPERWLQKAGELERNRLLFTFGSGGRGCIGKK